MNPALIKVLAPAYAPCVEFRRSCADMRWSPADGHVPRGFVGATGSLQEVELVLVFAEPGDPHDGERHTGLESTFAYSYFAHGTGKDLFHRNVRKILSLCWPALTFDEQLRKCWLTESVLCSALKEGGSVPTRASRACGERYLRAQLSLFPNALIAALGSKAKERLRALHVNEFVSAYAAAPPGCNRSEALPSWEIIASELRRRTNHGAQHGNAGDRQQPASPPAVDP